MGYFVLLALFLAASCGAQDNDYEYASGEPLDGTSLEAHRYYVEDSADSENSSYQESDEPQKREVPVTPSAPADSTSEAISTQKPQIPLADLIGNVEGTIFQSALTVVSYTKTQNANSDSGSTNESASNRKRSAKAVDDLTSEQDSVFKYVTARSIPATENQPAHYVVDEIAISNAHDGLAPLISSLDFHVQSNFESSVVNPTLTTQNHEIQNTGTSTTEAEATTSDVDVTMFVTPTHAAQIVTTKSSLDDVTTEDVKIALKSASSPASTASTSTPSSSSTSTTTAIPSTTTKTPIEKLKEAEDSLKEKVAEIEAEPVILSARV